MAREQSNAHEIWGERKKICFRCHENHISMLL